MFSLPCAVKERPNKSTNVNKRSFLKMNHVKRTNEANEERIVGVVPVNSGNWSGRFPGHNQHSFKHPKNQTLSKEVFVSPCWECKK